MEWKEMIAGGRAALMLLVFTIGVAVTIAINSFVGLFIGGSLEVAGNAANFSTEVDAGFTTTVANLITNITGVQTPFALWISLLSVILVLAVFAGFIYLGYSTYKKGRNKSGQGSDMGY